MKKIAEKIADLYENKDFEIEVVDEEDQDGKNVLAWYNRKGYGVKLLCIGIPQEDIEEIPLDRDDIITQYIQQTFEGASTCVDHYLRLHYEYAGKADNDNGDGSDFVKTGSRKIERYEYGNFEVEIVETPTLLETGRSKMLQMWIRRKKSMRKVFHRGFAYGQGLSYRNKAEVMRALERELPEAIDRFEVNETDLMGEELREEEVMGTVDIVGVAPPDEDEENGLRVEIDPENRIVRIGDYIISINDEDHDGEKIANAWVTKDGAGLKTHFAYIPYKQKAGKHEVTLKTADILHACVHKFPEAHAAWENTQNAVDISNQRFEQFERILHDIIHGTINPQKEAVDILKELPDEISEVFSLCREADPKSCRTCEDAQECLIVESLAAVLTELKNSIAEIRHIKEMLLDAQEEE